MKTKREVFDIVKNHLLSMKSQAKDVNEDVEFIADCKYLTSDGRKCAVGILIPDGHDAQQWQGSVFDLIKEYPKYKKYKLPDEIYEYAYMLKMLQEIHDENENWTLKGLGAKGKKQLDKLEQNEFPA